MSAHSVRPGLVDPRDFLNTDALLNDQERLLRDTVRRFVSDKILPDVAEWFEAGTFPLELAKEMGSLGLLGMHLDGYGCAGTSNVEYGLACLELEAGDSGTRSFVSVQGSLAMYPIRAYGSEEQKQQWLPAMAAGDAIGCFGLTESDAGSDPGAMRTVARQDGPDWVLNGSKMWITNGNFADVAVVWAQTDGGIRGFVVPTDTPGFTAIEIHQKMSLRASVTSELVLDDVRLPADAVLPALDYAGERVMFGKPIASFQLIQRQLAEMVTAVNAGTLMALQIGRMKDAGDIDPAHISMGKFNNVRMALDVARTARSVLGANGITLEYPVIRHMNNLESVYTYEGTHEIHTLIIGQAVTGVAAFE